ncbi:MAG: hypothetical protein IGR76_03965 [Synechococcales cyanobacterium T60_A2020_003]|nr:hypothetical protein [Synechococcales cyanobacterium T60_A2020_003]
MLQDPRAIRYYQHLTDELTEQWNRGYRLDELRLYVDGYLAALRQSSVIEPFLVHHIEEEVTRFLYDPSNFATSVPGGDFYS